MNRRRDVALLAVHLKGAFLCSQAVVPNMKNERWGRIVSTSSRAAYKPLWSGMSDYSAAKAAIVGLSKALAVELGPWGITAELRGSRRRSTQ